MNNPTPEWEELCFWPHPFLVPSDWLPFGHAPQVGRALFWPHPICVPSDWLRSDHAHPQSGRSLVLGPTLVSSDWLPFDHAHPKWVEQQINPTPKWEEPLLWPHPFLVPSDWLCCDHAHPGHAPPGPAHLGGDHVGRDDVDVELLEELPALHRDEIPGQRRLDDTCGAGPASGSAPRLTWGR